MARTSIDYEGVYQALPGMVALLTPDLVFADVNEAYVRGTGRPARVPAGPPRVRRVPGVGELPRRAPLAPTAGLAAAGAGHGERDAMPLQRYDIESPEHSGDWHEQYWSPVNSPVLGPESGSAAAAGGVDRLLAGGDPRPLHRRTDRAAAGGRRRRAAAAGGVPAPPPRAGPGAPGGHRAAGTAAAGRRHGRHGAGRRTAVRGLLVRRRCVRGRGGWCGPRWPGPRGRRWAGRRTRRRGSRAAAGPR